MIRIIPKSTLVEGRWRNGQGVSWEIASFKQDGTADFSWRFAKARIDNDVPFSIYPGMDRIFMMIEGGGMDLEFEGGRVLQVHEKFVPHEFSCDVPLVCKLLDGPSLDLNWVVARDQFEAECDVLSCHGLREINFYKNTTLVFALEGLVKCQDVTLEQGDAALIELEDLISFNGQAAKLYVGHIIKN